MGRANYYAKVTAVTDIRDNAAGRHDMGNLSVGTVIHVIEEYSKDGVLWLRFDKPNLTQPSYDETWCLASATTATAEVPDPEPSSGAMTLTLAAGESVKITIEKA